MNYYMHPIFNSSTSLVSLLFTRDHSFVLSINPWIIVLAIVICLIVLFLKYYFNGWPGSKFEIDKAEIGLGSGKISFKPNSRDQQIAYEIWVELSTRKIGLPIDLNHDVVSEIYDSWHHFFSVTRNLIRDIPVNKIKNSSTQKIINLSIDVLNKGLRPHLTFWQARFRHWYKDQLSRATGDIDPQSIQEKYPRFEELKTDLLIVNERLIKYREKMQELVMGTITSK